MIDAEKSLEEMEAEVLNARGHAMPVLKGTYRAMISTARGYWDPAAKRTRADFGDLSPTKLMQLGVFRETLRPRFQAWFLQDQTRWPGTNEEAASLLKALQADPRWSSAPAVRDVRSNPLDSYYTALMMVLHCRGDVQKELAKRAPGIYVLHRPSIVFRGRFVQGIMVCFVDDNTGALRTVEVHRMKQQSTRGHTGDGQNETAPPTPELEDILIGYMVQKSRQIQVHAVDMVSRAFSLTYLSTALRGPAFPDEPQDAVAERHGAGRRSQASRYLALDDDRFAGYGNLRDPGSGRSDLVSPFALLSGVTSGSVGGDFFAYPCVYSRLADLPPNIPRKAAELYAFIREKKDAHGKYVYRDLVDLVEVLPPLVAEQLKNSPLRDQDSPSLRPAING